MARGGLALTINDRNRDVVPYQTACSGRAIVATSNRLMAMYGPRAALY